MAAPSTSGAEPTSAPLPAEPVTDSPVTTMPVSETAHSPGTSSTGSASGALITAAEAEARAAASAVFSLASYAAPQGVYDEVYSEPGVMRPSWQRFADAAHRLSSEELSRRTQQAERLLRDNGMTFSVFGEATEVSRPWRLDMLPMMISSAEWADLERSLDQRGRLLDLIIRDLYGSRRLIREHLLPPEVIFAHPRYVRPFRGLRPESESSLLLYSVELARSKDGRWFVMADRSEAPHGPGFALENRIVVSRTLQQLVQQVGVQRLAPFFIRLQNALKKRAPRPSENLRIALLSSGAHDPLYFEDIYLARYLGFSLVEGGDLAVRDDRVYLKTLGGLLPIDVLFSRGGETGIDPLELGGAAVHGVPGLLQAVRKGNVAVANTPGSGLIESPLLMAFLPDLCQELLGEPLRLPSIATWWCGRPDHLRFVLDNLRGLVIKPAFDRSGSREILPETLSREAVAELRQRLQARPHDYIAQEKIARSASPTWHEGRIGCGHLALRTFLVAEDEEFSLMPGGLIRVAPTAGPMELSITAGQGSKDLWVLSDAPVEKVTLLVPEDMPVQLKRTGAAFPSRVADDLFWLGQSLERADFLCRVLRSVVERLTTEEDNSELPVLIRVLADQGQIEASFAIDSHQLPLAKLTDHLPKAVFDSTVVNGISQAASEMLRLASLARNWLSPDTWRTIHRVTTTFLAAPARRRGDLSDLLTTLNELLVDLAAVSGLIGDGMIRGPAWRFLDLGRRVERARVILGLLTSVLASGREKDRAVLRSVLEVLDCRMTYRSRYLDNIQQVAVFDLALTDETNPHSVVYQLVAISEHVDALPQDILSPLRSDEKRATMAAIHGVRMLTPDTLAESPPTTIEQLIRHIEGHLKTLTQTVNRKYLLHSVTPRQITGEAVVS